MSTQAESVKYILLRAFLDAYTWTALIASSTGSSVTFSSCSHAADKFFFDYCHCVYINYVFVLLLAS